MGTIGGLLGTFITSFYLLPVFGSHTTFAVNAYLVTTLALIWLFLSDKRWLIAMFVAPLIVQGIPIAPLATNIVHAEESVYSRLEVFDYDNIVGLRTDDRSGTAYSVIKKDGTLPPFLLYDLFAVPVAMSDAKRGLLLGLGAGTLPRIHEILNPDYGIEGVEIDPRVVALGDEYFGLGQRGNIQKIVIGDARPFLSRNNDIYDAIEMDIFRETEIPFYLASKEFFESTSAHLNSNGIFMMNIYDPTREQVIKTDIANTVASVYPNTYVVPAGLGSFFLVASKSPLSMPQINVAQGMELKKLADYFKSHVEKIKFSSAKEVFTDDRTPIETLYVASS